MRMSKEEIIDQCRTVMSTVMKLDKSMIVEDATPDEIEAWDSLSHQQMILNLEKNFNVEISPDESIEIESFEMLCELISDKMNV